MDYLTIYTLVSADFLCGSPEHLSMSFGVNLVQRIYFNLACQHNHVLTWSKWADKTRNLFFYHWLSLPQPFAEGLSRSCPQGVSRKPVLMLLAADCLAAHVGSHGCTWCLQGSWKYSAPKQIESSPSGPAEWLLKHVRHVAFRIMTVIEQWWCNYGVSRRGKSG